MKKSGQQISSAVMEKARYAFDIADRFLDSIGAPETEQVYLIGSYAEGTPGPQSDIDLLFVGQDFDQAEEERIEQSESGVLGFRLLQTTIEAHKRPGHPDVIFSSKGPRRSQARIKLYDISKGGWLV